jgi:hypothetical protein
MLLKTYQDVFELDVSVHESLGVKVADPFHHIHSHLQPTQQREKRQGKFGQQVWL